MTFKRNIHTLSLTTYAHHFSFKVLLIEKTEKHLHCLISNSLQIKVHCKKKRGVKYTVLLKNKVLIKVSITTIKR